MVDSVDDDGSGMNEIGEFLAIIKNKGGNEKTAKITEFFKNLSNGTLGNKDLSFNLVVDKIRRDFMMNGILGKGAEKEYGHQIIQHVKGSNQEREKRKENEDSEDD